MAPERGLPDEPFSGATRPMLDGFLDRYRASFLSLLGIARHLTDVERTYFRRRWGGEDLPSYYENEDFENASAATAERDLQRLVAEQSASRNATAGMDLDAVFVNPRWGEMTLRWALIHMIGEYAGHTGQADLLRERIDGKTGWW